jgi:hypothetical protein
LFNPTLSNISENLPFVFCPTLLERSEAMERLELLERAHSFMHPLAGSHHPILQEPV